MTFLSTGRRSQQLGHTSQGLQKLSETCKAPHPCSRGVLVYLCTVRVLREVDAGEELLRVKPGVVQVGPGISCFRPASPLARQVNVGFKHPAPALLPSPADLLCRPALMASSPPHRGLACDPGQLSTRRQCHPAWLEAPHSPGNVEC